MKWYYIYNIEKRGHGEMNWLRKFMTGRYGVDELNISLLIVSLLLSILSGITDSFSLSAVGAILIILYFYRALSKEIWKRRNENTKFLNITKPVRELLNRKYKYYKCPSCGQKLRLPKGKGKIQISCPKCRTEFIKRT